MKNWLPLLPYPQSLEMRRGSVNVSSSCNLTVQSTQSDRLARTCELIRRAIQEVGLSCTIGTRAEENPDTLNIWLCVEQNRVEKGSEYHLQIAEDGITISAGDEAGLFYGGMTLKQLLRLVKADGELACLCIKDWPDFPNRGLMLDISRDKVPTMDTLFDLIDLLAELKMNQFQLYTEHTFAYREHEAVWADASPMTAEEIRALDVYCKDRFIDLVPNQNSLAHFGRWLKHPEYAHLAELPRDYYHEKLGGAWWEVTQGGDCLCPIDPGSIALLKELYGQLLPNFSSSLFNIGGDETGVIGLGRSKAACEERGKGQVYLDFLSKIHQLVQEHGRTVQFWGDIILNYPELIHRLPQGIIALNWGYDPQHPYETETAQFLENGVEYYVCPGTNAWLSLIGRTDEAVANIQNAARWGLENHATGFLVTDWGDGGHWTHLPVSYLGYAYGAAMSWAGEANVARDLPEVLDAHVFQDKAQVMGRLAYDLGNATKIIREICLPIHFPERPFRELGLQDATRSDWEELVDYCQRIFKDISKAKMTRPDADLIIAEFENALDMVDYAAQLAIARLNTKEQKVSSIDEKTWSRLVNQRDALVAEFRRLWLSRNRPGGLKDSVQKMVTGWTWIP